MKCNTCKHNKKKIGQTEPHCEVDKTKISDHGEVEVCGNYAPKSRGFDFGFYVREINEKCDLSEQEKEFIQGLIMSPPDHYTQEQVDRIMELYKRVRDDGRNAIESKDTN